jgi:uncharacterized protein DUF6601
VDSSISQQGAGAPPSSSSPVVGNGSQPGINPSARQDGTTNRRLNQTAQSTHIPQSVLDTLPTFFHHGDNKDVFLVPKHLGEWLESDLNLDRLDVIHSHLWACGRPFNARPIHRHVLLNRKIVITEQADLHLLYYSDILMIKPLPTYILCKQVWKEYLNKDKKLHESACGLLLSWIWLVRSPHDFQFAMDKERQLLPPEMTWLEWKRIVDETLEYIDPDSLKYCHRRYQFGELRLGRINRIYRLNPRFISKNFVRGYLYGYNRYEPFLQRNVAWVLAASVLFSLVLSAMQVGIGLPELQTNSAFTKASFGFVIFSCVLVGAVMAFVFASFGLVFFYNMIAATSHSKNEQARRAKLRETNV